MKRTLLYALASVTLLTAAARLAAAEAEEGFTPLCDGKTFNGWKMAEENKDTWKIQDGAFVAQRQPLPPVLRWRREAVQELPPEGGGDDRAGLQRRHLFPHEIPAARLAERRVRMPGQQHPWRLDQDRQPLWAWSTSACAPAQDDKWWTQEIIVKGNTRHGDHRRQEDAANTPSRPARSRARISSASSARARSPCRATTPRARSATRTSASSGSTEPAYLTRVRICLNSAVPACSSSSKSTISVETITAPAARMRSRPKR